jgi:wobble nucleotide-excising tRNase
MITKIDSLEYIGKFQKFEWRSDVPSFSRVNLIFGYNGSGKTLISNVFRLFSKQREDENDLLFKELSTDNNARIEISVDGKKIHYSPAAERKDIYVFNSDFISEHVFDGTVAKCKEFDSAIVTREHLRNPQIAKIEQELNTLNNECQEQQNQKKKLEDKFEEIKGRLSTEFNAKIKGKRAPSINIPNVSISLTMNEIKQELKRAYEDFSLSQKQEKLNSDIQELEILGFNKIDVDFERVSKALAVNLPEEARKKVQRKIDALRTVKLKNSTLNEWLENGYQLLQYSKNMGRQNCPLCESSPETGFDDIITDYQAFFSGEYNSLITELDTLLHDYQSHRSFLELNKKGEEKLTAIEGRYSEIYTRKKEKPSLKGDEAKKALEEVIASLQSKKSNPEKVIGEIPLGLRQYLEGYNSSIADLDNIKKEILAILKNKSLDPDKIIAKIKPLMERCAHVEFDSFDEGDQIENYKRVQREIRDFDENIKKLRLQRSKEISKLKDESRYVNTFLKQLSITHFSVLIGKRWSEDNIQINFSSGVTRSKLRHSLSESEKTALAFAYFLSKIKYEILDNNNADIKKVIIVIDDPISSLDENRLHITACIISGLFEAAEQLFVLSHNLLFMRFMNNLIGNPRIKTESGESESCRRDYYLSSFDNKLRELPTVLRNYRTSYFQKVNDLIRYREGNLLYEEAKQFLPNHIRIVLETFLSFKFCVLTQGSSDDRYRSPGLDKLINFIKNKKHLFSFYEQVGDINPSSIIAKLEQIRKVTDPQSHGTPQDIDEVTFLSEDELKNMAKDTLDIIGFLDKIHYGETTSH